jgi:hypothetical protein
MECTAPCRGRVRKDLLVYSQINSVLRFPSIIRIYLRAGAINLRKSFHTLAGIICESIRVDPASELLLVFTNSRQIRFQILFRCNTG